MRGRGSSPGWVLLTPLLPWLAALPGGRFAVPLVAPLTLYFAFRERVRAGRHGGAWSLGVAWAALLSLGFILQVFLAPDLAATTLRGEPYRQEMFHWIATGEGSEGEWRRFLPTHLSHFTLFVVLCWVSGGYLGLVLGAVLMGYMSYFVGSYAAAAGAPLLGSLVAWVPWSVIRVLAFILVGCLFARPLLVRRIWPFERRELRLLLLGLAGILADILLKALAADTYGVFLRGLAGGGVG